MKILSLVINNLFNLEHTEIEFAPGQTALTGPNGSGKTNSLSALRWCVTGDFGDGITASMAVQQGKEDEQSSAILTMDVDGHKAVLTRTLNSDSRRLVVGKETISSDAKIKERMSAWLGMPIQVAADHLFVAQGDLTSFFRLTGAEQARSVQRLFGLDRAEVCWKALGNRLARSDVLETISAAELEARIRTREMERQLAVTQRDALDYKDSDKQRIEYCRKLLSSYEQQRKLSQQYSQQIERQQALNVQRLELYSAASEATAALAEAEQVLATIDRAALQAAAQAHNERQRRLPRIDVAQAELSELHWSLNTFRTQAVPAAPWNEADEQLLSETHYRANTCRDFLHTFADGAPECPTCHTPAASLPWSVMQVQNFLTTRDEEIRRLTERKAANQRYTQYEDQLRQLQDRLVLQERSLAALVDGLPPEPAQSFADVDELSRSAATLSDLVARNRQRLGQQQHQQSQINGQLAEVDQATTKLAAARAELEQELVGEPSEESLRLWLGQCEEAAARYQNFQGQIQALDKCLANDQKDLERARRLESEAGVLKEWRGDLMVLRDKLHRDQLPKTVAAHRMRLLETGINNRLQVLGADFTVAANEDATMSAVFGDGHGGLVSQYLSGGQLAVLGLALYLELARGLLVLDEPTYGLDSSRMACLRDAFEALRQSAGSSDLQVIVVTHAQSLLSAFDRVVTLAAPVVL